MSTFYVATTGNDSNPGTSLSPFLSINKGISVLSPGDTLIIKPGTYTTNGNISNTPITGGTAWTAGNFMRIQTLNHAGGVLINLQSGFWNFADAKWAYVEFEGGVYNGIIIDATNAGSEAVSINQNAGTHHLRLKNIEVKNGNGADRHNIIGGGTGVELINVNSHHTLHTAAYCLYLNGGNSLVQGGEYHDGASYGLHIYGNPTLSPSAPVTIERVKAYNNGWEGMIIGRADNHIVRNNLYWNNGLTGGGQPGLAIGYVTTGTKVYNNTSYDNDGPGYQIGHGGTATNTLFKNNIAKNNGGAPVHIEADSTGAVVQFNLFHGNGNGNAVLDEGTSSTVSSNVTGDPLFVNAAGNDFHLLSTSAAIDVGLDLTSEGITTDFDGAPRPINAGFDIGAYEFFTESGENPTEGTGSFTAGATLSGVGAFVAPEGIGSITAGAIFQGVGESLAVEGIGSIIAGASFNGQAQFVTGSPGAPPQTAENPKTFVLRVKEARIGANGIVEFDLVREDLSIYDTVAQNPLLSSGTHGGTPAPTEPPVDDDSDQSKPGSTRLVLLDIPQLLFQHDGPGFYVAASGANDGWVGTILYEKIGSEFVEILQIGTRAVIGTAATRLDPGPVTTFDISGRTYVFDDVATVDITLIDNVSILTSVSDTQLFAGVNAAALGHHGEWEIFSFGTATQLAPRKWRLSHLLRGLKGTEWAINMHGVGDGFVLLDQAIRRVNDAYTDLDISRTFKAASIGATFESGNTVGFTNEGVSLKPLSPIFIRAEEDSVQNRTIRWYRRSRLNGLAGRDTYDPAPPLGESIERYEVDILNSAGTAVLRTITVSTEEALYTAAQQTADHGSVPSSLNVCIYQISETRGRGYSGCATIVLFDSVPSVLPGTHPVWVLLTVPTSIRATTKYIIAPSVLVFFFPEDFVGSRATLETATTGSLVLSIKKNGSDIGTITFAAAGTVGTFVQIGSGDISFNATSDKLTVVSPGAQDPTALGLGVSLLGYRIAA